MSSGSFLRGLERHMGDRCRKSPKRYIPRGNLKTPSNPEYMMSSFQSSAMTQAPSISVRPQEQTVLTEMRLEARVYYFLYSRYILWGGFLSLGPVHNTVKPVHVQKQRSVRCFQSVLRSQSAGALPSLYSVPKLVSSHFLIFQGWSSQRSCIL